MTLYCIWSLTCLIDFQLWERRPGFGSYAASIILGVWKVIQLWEDSSSEFTSMVDALVELVLSNHKTVRVYAQVSAGQ
jgi:hypothetical protein